MPRFVLETIQCCLSVTLVFVGYLAKAMGHRLSCYLFIFFKVRVIMWLGVLRGRSIRNDYTVGAPLYNEAADIAQSALTE